MQSKTSSFKGGLFSKAMFIQSCKLYAPLPVVYFVGMFLQIPMRFFMFEGEEIQNSSYADPFLGALSEIPGVANYAGALVTVMISLVCAMMSFRYVFLGRSSNMIHSLPIRREGLYVTQYFVGLAMMVVPNLGILLLTLMASAVHGYFYPLPVLLWFISQTGLCFFFYSFAVFCGMFTGALGGQPLYYIVFNFIAMFIAMVLEPLFTLYYVGYAGSSLSTGLPRLLTPAYSLTQGSLVKMIPTKDAETGMIVDFAYKMNDAPLFWGYMVVGLVFSGLGLLIYRQRHLETVGEAVSMKFMRPIFRVFIAVLGGISLGIGTVLLLDLYNEDLTRTLFIPSSLFWGLVFFFLAEMMLQRNFHVWRRWKKCAVPLVAIAGIYALLIFDLSGFEDTIPAKDQIRQASISALDGYSKDTASSLQFLVFDEEEGITQEMYDLLTDFHRSSIQANREDHAVMYNKNPNYTITYTLESGDKLIRSYYAPIDPGEKDTLERPSYYLHRILNDPQRIEESYRLDQIKDTQLSVEISNLYHTQEDAMTDLALQDVTDSFRHAQEMSAALVEALQKDFAAGHLGEKFISYQEEDYLENQYLTALNVSWTDMDIRNVDDFVRTPGGDYQWTGEGPTPTMQSGEFSVSVSLSPKAKHTLAVLEQYELIGVDHTLVSPMGRLILAQKWNAAGERQKNSGILWEWEEGYVPTYQDFFYVLQ